MLAYRISVCLAVLSAGSFGAAFALLISDSTTGMRLVLFIVGAAAVVTGVTFGHVALLRLTEEAGERILFETFIPMVMSLVPVAGLAMAVWSVIKLLRGRLAECTITISSGGSTSSHCYPAANIGRAGVPTALCFLVLMCLQPLVCLYIYRANTRLEEPSSPKSVEQPYSQPNE